MTTPILEVEELEAGYGDLRVLQGISLHVGRGEVVSVVGANGAGKTTLLGALSGIVRRHGGSVLLDGQDISDTAPDKVVAAGLVLVPEGRHLFPFLTVEENLELGAYHHQARKELTSRLEEVFDLFPLLADRLNQQAGTLSGGEQQMCAIARGLMSDPKILMLDEPSEGLAPIIVERVFELIERLKQTNLTVLLVEQNVGDALDLADRGYVIEQGRLVMAGTGQELLADSELQRAYLGF